MDFARTIHLRPDEILENFGRTDELTPEKKRSLDSTVESTGQARNKSVNSRKEWKHGEGSRAFRA